MKNKRITAILLIVVMLIGLTACKNIKESSTEDTMLQLNEHDNKASYPYFMETPSATWYLSADDIEVQGL